ncbi:MAG: hypothetical protein WCO23_01665 [bacterium]
MAINKTTNALARKQAIKRRRQFKIFRWHYDPIFFERIKKAWSKSRWTRQK